MRARGGGRPPEGPARPDCGVRSLCLECSVRLPGYERITRPARNVDDYPLVVDRPS